MNDGAPKTSVNPNRSRDHLANERTYLAWVRTAIALIGFGIFTVRFHSTSAQAGEPDGF